MTDRARELVARARRYRKDNLRETSTGYALFGELADFIEQSLTPPEGDTVSEGVVEQVAEALWRAEWAEGHEPPHSWDAMCSEDWDIAEAFRVQARAAIAALQSRVSPQAGINEELLREKLFILSDRLRASGILSASDAVHEAYEAVVAALPPTQEKP